MVIKKPSTQGRRKIEMTKIPNKSNLQVTFSKRRSGLFKKASELCTLCGVEIAILVFSPANKPFSFGHPGFDSVADRFLAQKPPTKCCHTSTSHNQSLVEPHIGYSSEIIHDLYVKLSDVNGQLEEEKKKGQALDEAIKNESGNYRGLESPVDELTIKEIEMLKASMEELKNIVDLKKQVLNYDAHFENKPTYDQIVGNSASNFPLANCNFGFGNGIF